MDARDFFRRIGLEDCERASLTGESTPELTDLPTFNAVLREFEREGTVYMYNTRNGSVSGPCKMIAGFTEKGKRIYMPHGKLLDSYRLKRPDQATESNLKKDEGPSNESANGLNEGAANTSTTTRKGL